MGYFKGCKLHLFILAITFLLSAACADRRSEEPGCSGGSTTFTNVYALHDTTSSQYRNDCLSCHCNVLTEQSLEPSIPHAHPAMLARTPGSTNQDKCLYCHKTTDLLQFSAGNIRRNVSVETCVPCHGKGGISTKQFYQ